MQRVACAVWLALSLFATPLLRAQNVGDLTADQILTRAADAYRQCESYQDSGQVVTDLKSDFLTLRQTKPFSTAMVRRNDQFRYEYTEPSISGDERYLVWASRGSVRTWWSARPEVKREESLDLALAGATGVSGGSAHTVPALLMPDAISGAKITELANAVRAGDAPVSGAICFQIRGEFGGGPVTVWIDQATFLIRRIEEQSPIADSTTTYFPTANIAIDPALLRFDPPTGLAALWYRALHELLSGWLVAVGAVILVVWILRRKRKLSGDTAAKITVEIDAVWARRVKSPWFLVVAACTGVSVTFMPLFLYWCGRGVFPESQWWFVPACFAAILIPSLFYNRLAGEVLRALAKRDRLTTPSQPPRSPPIVRAVGRLLGRLRGAAHEKQKPSRRK